MREDDFLKEKQNIRQKMLKYSRAISQGRPLDDEFRDETQSDVILRRRFKKRKALSYEDFDGHEEKKSNIYLKEDLINVKLDEEKQPLSFKVLSYLKDRKRRKIPIQKRNKKGFFALKKKKKFIPEPEAKIQKKDKGHSRVKNLPILSKNEAPKNEALSRLNSKPQTIPLPQKMPAQTMLPPQTLTPKMIQEDPPKDPSDENAQRAKNTLLEGYIEATTEDRNLNFHHLLFAALLLSFALFLFAPQIYIRNQIYYLSKEIATLKTEESVLTEENKELKRRLENMRFQNQILDYLE
ncbi:hypothetical protein [Campylobacter sp.]|uniref:hypothetical protein n=1 Tax=Campylobacter sp. TaxID=205 RepID=UPI0026DD8939|nr:hypothetical protein [Campylobacter sp.]MDO4674519.1 hypothetical protein [Campylobacter sp.]